MVPVFRRDKYSATKDQWTCEARPSGGLRFAAAASLAALIAATMIIVLTRLSRGAVPAVIVMSMCVMELAARAFARTSVVIDCGRGAVSITTVRYLWNKRNVRKLGEFDKVAVWERRKLLGAGYCTSHYSVMLLGGNGPLPLLTTDDENEAVKVRDELASFLRFR